jgi:hypothetical protein
MAGNFWSSVESQPKRQFTFVVDMGDIPRFAVATAKKPSLTVEMAEVSWLNHTFKYPGRVKWNDISMTFYDPINPDVAKSLYLKLKNSGYYWPETPGTLQTVSKKDVTLAIGNVLLSQLDHSGMVIETWTLKNAWFSALNFGNLDYKSNEVITIEMTLVYDWAEISGVNNT